MRFFIEQIAIRPPEPEAAIALLSELGMDDWSRDHVTANGAVYGIPARNEADLAFNYQAAAGKLEFEVLHYTRGDNWMQYAPSSVSHLGMHCTAEQLEGFRAKFAELNILVAQEVDTENHTNPVIAGKRWYKYVIFATRHILGVDLKFIVRKEQP
jgi:hypothetical protein